MTEQELTVELGSLAETERLGRFLGEIAEPGDVIILNGPLGAGKTTITQFIGAGLKVPKECYITSPTFSLMHEYPVERFFRDSKLGMIGGGTSEVQKTIIARMLMQQLP